MAFVLNALWGMSIAELIFRHKEMARALMRPELLSY